MADENKPVVNEHNHQLMHALEAEHWYLEQAERTSHMWGERLDHFELPCPLCKGELQFQGVRRDRLYEFAEGEPGVVTPLNVLPISFVCNRCGYTAEFDAQLFNPAYLAAIQGAAPERIAELSVRDFRVLVPLAGEEKNQTLLDLASALAGVRNGEVIVLNVAPDPVNEQSIAEKLQHYKPNIGDPAPVQLLVQHTDHVGETIVHVARRQRCELLMVGWRGWTRNQQAVMGTVLDPVLNEAVCDVAVVHDRGLHTIRRILLPTAGGPNMRAAVRVAYDLARAFNAELHLINVVASDADKDKGREQIEKTLHNIGDTDGVEIERRVLVGIDPVRVIVDESANYDLLLIGASHRTWLGRIRRGSVVAKIIRNCNPTSIVVSARQSRIGSWLVRLFG
jgi:nucleotide-binding universal stress UspA family protein